MAKMSQYAGPKVRCKVCDDVIQSMFRHDFKWCKGHHIFVDGGADYLRMGGAPENAEVLDAQGKPKVAKKVEVVRASPSKGGTE